MREPILDRTKIPALEGLRGIMAWWVVLGHLALSFGMDAGLLNRNTLPVDVFIMLSGFVIFRMIDRKAEPYLPYIIRRAFRIFPLYLVVLLVSAALVGVQLSAWSHMPIRSDANIARVGLASSAVEHFWLQVLVHVPLLQGLFPTPTPFTVVGQAWSISLEWQFYLIAPWLFLLFKRPHTMVVALALLALLHFVPGMSKAFLGNKIWFFAIGIGTYLGISRPAMRPTMVALLVVSACLVIRQDGIAECLPLAIWGAVILSAHAPARSFARLLATLLSARPLVRTGELSFSIYMVHMLPLFGTIYLLNRAGFAPPAYIWITTPVVVVVTYLVAKLCHIVIEKPCIARGADLAAKSTSSALPGAAVFMKDDREGFMFDRNIGR